MHLSPLRLVIIVSILPTHSLWLVGLSWMKWWVGLPQLQSIRLGDGSFTNTRTIVITNLTSLQSIEFGQNCFGGYSSGGASSFSLIGLIERVLWRIGLPQLQSVKLGDYAFQYTKSFEMSNLTSLQSIEFGQRCFYWAPSFSLIGIHEWMWWQIGFPQLQFVRLGNRAFASTKSFEISNLTSLQSVEIGDVCFAGHKDWDILKGGATSVVMRGINN